MGRKSEQKTVVFEMSDGKKITKEIETFPWEKLDYVQQIKKAFKL
jgi:S-adenosylmethionine synthetase